MKKIALALVAFMLVLGMTQCKKEQQPNNTTSDEGETVYITMKVADNGDKHIVYPGTGAVVYSDGDVIYVGNNGKYVGSLTYANGTFSGSITNPSTTDYLHFYFTGGKTPATAPTVGSTTSFTVDISDQSSKLPVLSYGHSTSKYIDGTTAYTCMLENQCGLVKFSNKSYYNPYEISEPVAVEGMKTTATIDFATPGITPTDDRGAITLYPFSDTEKWAILLPQEKVVCPKIRIEGWEGIIFRSFDIYSVQANSFSNGGILLFSPYTHTFTVNSNGDKVLFSQGNLQYIGSAATPYWKFAENQWEYFGETTGQCSESQTVDRDLFGWGTSGYENGNLYYQPYDVGWNSSSEIGYGYGPKHYYYNYNYGLTGDCANADWGVYNAISNGGNTPNQWRTLTDDEWDYLINQRPGCRWALAVVNGVNGAVLFPDNNSSSWLQNVNTWGGTRIMRFH